jgi:hypothetical protein
MSTGDGTAVPHRVDRRNLEPGNRVHEDQSGLQKLLRTPDGTSSPRDGATQVSEQLRRNFAPRPA